MIAKSIGLYLVMQKIAERRPSILDQYAFRLSRDYPVIWATRFDVVLAFFVVAMIAAPWLVTSWQPSISSAYYYSAAQRKLDQGTLMVCLVSFLVSIYWIFARLNSLQLSFAPKLRALPWSLEAHIALLMFFMPAIATYLAVAPEYFRTSGSSLDAAVPLAMILAAGSFLACFVVSARRFGFASTLAGVVVIAGQLIVALLLINLFFWDELKQLINWLAPNRSNNSDSQFITAHIVAAIYFALFMLVPRRSLKGTWLYFVFYPALYSASTGLFLGLPGIFPPGNMRVGSLSEVVNTLVFLLGIYALSAVLTELISLRAGRQRSLN